MATKKKSKRKGSVSGKFKTIYHLLEVMFARNKNLTSDAAMVAVKREFPGSAYVKTNHFPWYKTHIVSHREFRFIPLPAWAKGNVAKII